MSEFVNGGADIQSNPRDARELDGFIGMLSHGTASLFAHGPSDCACPCCDVDEVETPSHRTLNAGSYGGAEYLRDCVSCSGIPVAVCLRCRDSLCVEHVILHLGSGSNYRDLAVVCCDACVDKAGPGGVVRHV